MLNSQLVPELASLEAASTVMTTRRMKPESLESETLTNMKIKEECNPNSEEEIDPITPASTAFPNGAPTANNAMTIKQESITEDQEANNALTIKQESLTEDEEANNARLSDEEMRARLIDEHFQVVTVQAYKCKECHFITTEFKLLNKHLEEKHQIYLSGNFEKQASNHDISNLINNMSSPSMFDDNPDAVNCTECNKTFANKKNLGSHVRAVHLQIKNHICKICNKGFFKPSKLKKHELTHKDDESDYISHEPGQDFVVECTPDIISQNSSSDSENDDDVNHRVEMLQRLLQLGMTVFDANKERSHAPQAKKGGYVKKFKPFTEYILQEGPEDFTCTWCNKKFVKKYACGKHIRAVHFVERRHICQHCQKGFFLKKSFDTHINSRHHSVEDNCQICKSKVFHTPRIKVKRNSIKERIIVEEDGNFACRECFTKFPKMLDCVRHIRMVHFGQKRHLCKHCKRGFFSTKNLINHINTTHHNVEEHCHECQSQAKVKPVIKIEGGQSKVSDYLYQEDEDNFICTGCEKKFSKKINCIMHIRAVHVVEKKHCCQHCPRRFFGSGDLRKHVNSSHHSILDDCQDCNFTLRNTVSTHQCALCPLSVPLKMLAKDHLRTHSTTCEYCSEQFDHIDKLVDHVNTLHTEYSFVPNYEALATEEKKAKNKNTSHVAIKKEYSCPVCDLTFSKEHGLLSHIGFAHRKTTSNVCEVCHAVLSSRKILNKHMRFSHGPKNFACEKCSKAFARKDHLAKHSKGCKG